MIKAGTIFTGTGLKFSAKCCGGGGGGVDEARDAVALCHWRYWTRC